VAATARRFEIFVRAVVGITLKFEMADANTSVMHRGKEWALQPGYVAKPDARSALWGLLNVYQREEGREPVADLVVRCRVCAMDGVKRIFSLRVKHQATAANSLRLRETARPVKFGLPTTCNLRSTSKKVLKVGTGRALWLLTGPFAGCCFHGPSASTTSDM